MPRATPSHRVGALLFVTFLATAVLPPSSAAEEPMSGALDPLGDVYPVAWAAGLPGSVEHAELYDLARFEVKHESKADFVFELQVGDLPDDWILEAAPPGGAPVPPIKLSTGQTLVAWDDGFLENKVTHSVYFTIDGKRFVAVAALGELNLQNPNAFPHANSTQYLVSLLGALDTKLVAAKAEVQKTPLGLLWTTSVQNDVSAQIDEARAKLASLVHLIDDACDVEAPREAGLPSDPAACKASIAAEFENLDLIIAGAQADAVGALPGSQGSKLDRAFGDLSKNLTEAQGVFANKPAAVFDGSDDPLYEADLPAASMSPSPGVGNLPSQPKAPSAVLFHRFTLYSMDANGNRSEVGPLGGALDLEKDTLRMTLERDDVGAKMGSKLTQFRAEAAFRSSRVDYAPDALAGNPTPQQLPFAVAGQQVVTPAYGKDYSFAVEEAKPGEVQPPVRVQLGPVGPVSVEIAPGGSATYYVTLKNVATAPLTGFLSLSAPNEGWTAQASETIWSLTGGSSQTFTVVVAGIGGSLIEETTTLTATVDGGESASTQFRTTMKESPPAAPGEGGEKVADKKKGRVPGFEAVALLAALGALVVVARRRLD